ncbi:MAG: DUF1127 domain-containing protein [Pseudomonadota bacterium]
MTHALHTAQIQILNADGKLPVLAGLAVKFAVLVVTWDTRRKSRRVLKDLAPHLLRDIGLDAATAQAEAAKPFWQD